MSTICLAILKAKNSLFANLRKNIFCLISDLRMNSLSCLSIQFALIHSNMICDENALIYEKVEIKIIELFN